MFVFFHIYSYEVVPFKPTCTSNALSHLALLVVVLKQFASHASFSRSVSACAECPLLVIYPCACCSVKVKVMHASHRVPLLVPLLVLGAPACYLPVSQPECLSQPACTCLTCLVSVCLLVFLSFQETACILLLFKELMATFFRHGLCVSLYRLILLSCYPKMVIKP